MLEHKIIFKSKEIKDCLLQSNKLESNEIHHIIGITGEDMYYACVGAQTLLEVLLVIMEFYKIKKEYLSSEDNSVGDNETIHPTDENKSEKITVVTSNGTRFEGIPVQQIDRLIKLLNETDVII